MGSERWFREFERLFNEKRDKGMSERHAEDEAAREADGALVERLSDAADMERKRRKEEGK